MVDISISNKQMKPAVIHTNQSENGVHELCFTLADYNQNGVDLRDFKAYVVTSINGVIDITEVPYTESGRSLKITWVLSSYTLREPGVIQYQIRFSESEADGAAVWYSYKGVIVNRLSINADDHVSANYPTLMKQWLDLMHTLSSEFGAPITYMLPGESIPVEERLANRMYYQWLDTPNSAATCATGMVNLGKRPYADSGLYINNTHICVDTTNEVAYVIDPGIWVNAINNADCGVVATDISSGDEIIILISAKEAGASGNSIGLKLDVATYGAGAGETNPSGGHVSGSTLEGGYDSTVGVDNPRGRLEDSHGNTLHYAHLLEDFNFSKGTVQAQIDGMSIVPDYANAVDITSNFASSLTFTATKNGTFVVIAQGAENAASSFTLKVDNFTVSNYEIRDTDAAYAHPQHITVPVAKGNVVTMTKTSGSITRAVFIPSK